MFQMREVSGVAGEEVQQAGLQHLPGEADHQARVQQVGRVKVHIIMNCCVKRVMS